MKTWKDQPWLCIDTETTGLTPGKDRIIELGVMLAKQDGILDSFAWLLDPGIPIPAESTAVHGLTDADVRGKPMLWSRASHFLALVRSPNVLVGYNWPFDASFLEAELGQMWRNAIADKTIIDPLVVARLASVGKYWPGSGRHKLSSVAERLGVACPVGAHRVTADCAMTVGVLRYLLSHLPDDADQAAELIRTERVKQDQEREEYHRRHQL